MSKIMETQKKIENGVVSSYKAIENGVVSGYKAIENGVVEGYKKIEDKFVEKFLDEDPRTKQPDGNDEQSDGEDNTDK